MPVKGVQKEGFVGAGKGFCKGVGNALGNFGEGRQTTDVKKTIADSGKPDAGSLGIRPMGSTRSSKSRL